MAKDSILSDKKAKRTVLRELVRGLSISLVNVDLTPLTHYEKENFQIIQRTLKRLTDSLSYNNT